MIYKRNTIYPSITEYVLYGERHSGTNFFSSILNQYLTIPRSEKFGFKHWFGFTDHKLIVSSPRTLFVCIVRNPYDWLNGFYLTPYHVPRKNQRTFDMFISKEWYSINDIGEELLEDRNYLSKNRYLNILEMRKYKLYYLRQILYNICDNYILVRYEDLIQNPISIIHFINNYFSITMNYENKHIHILPKGKYYTDPTALDFINQNIDWNIEHMVGYEKQLD